MAFSQLFLCVSESSFSGKYDVFFKNQDISYLDKYRKYPM